MQFFKFGSGLLLLTILSGAIGQTANALPLFPDVYKDMTGNIYASGTTPSLATEFVFSGITQTKSVVSNSCGAISLKGSASSPLPSSLTIFGTEFRISELSTQLKPKCTTGSWDVRPSANFKTASGEVVFIGLPPNAAIPVNFSGTVVKRPNANECGIAKLSKAGSFTPSGAFTITGINMSYTVDRLVVNETPDICKNGVLYRALKSAPPVIIGG